MTNDHDHVCCVYLRTFIKNYKQDKSKCITAAFVVFFLSLRKCSCRKPGPHHKAGEAAWQDSLYL